MHSMYLIDTNVLSELTKALPSPAVLAWFAQTPQHQVFISAVTVCEVKLGLALMPSGKRQEALSLACEALLSVDFGQRCLPLDANCAGFYGTVAMYQKQAGRTCGVEDALIAATALAHQCTLVTRNTKDFADIPGLLLVNPWN